jgi:opacity protein-like surface antigen
MKTILFSLFLCFTLCQSALAKSLKLFDGAYVGVLAGIDLGKIKNTVSGKMITGNGIVNNGSDISTNGLIGGIFLGYSKTFKKILFGAELGAELITSKGTKNYNFSGGDTIVDSAKVRKKNSFYVMGRIGKQINDFTLAYVKGGLSEANYNFNYSLQYDGGGAQMNPVSNNNKRIIQPVAGGGVEVIVGKILYNLRLRIGLEYEHVFGRKINIDVNNNNFKGGTTYYPTSNAIKFRIIFKF